MFLYLAARFIVALQQDVDERISENSLGGRRRRRAYLSLLLILVHRA